MDRTQPGKIGVFAGVLLAVFAWLLAGHAAAQEPSEDDSASGEVIAKCPWFGVGGFVRPGEWAGLRLTIKDSADKPREVLVRIGLPDPDGDKVLYEGRITTNPGVALPLWQYLYLPSQFKQQDVLTVSCFAAVEEGKGTGGGFGAGRLLGTSRIRPRIVAARTEGLLALVSSRRMGLELYRGDGYSMQNQGLPTGHERVQIADALTPDTLPDRWFGLRQFDVLVWNEPPPGALGSDKAQAVREWVQRGGHLVVVLPRVGQAWTDEANNPLYDITPRVAVDRHEGVDLAPYRRLITKAPALNADRSPGLTMPKNEVLQTFRPLEGATPTEAVCILSGIEREAGKGAEWLVARRIVGAGMVDLVGLDVGSTWMTQRSLPDPETFWHRILGRRGLLFSPVEMNSKSSLLPYMRELTTVDRDIPTEIGMSGSASVGVLMGLAVFGTYWLIAGPLGYAALRKTGYQRHAWVAFIAAAGVFTALAWGGATAIRPAQLRAQHLSFLDHVYSTASTSAIERSRSWVSLLVPEYGDATVCVGDPAMRGSSSFHNTLAPWDAEGGQGAFPDARGYRVDSKSPDQFSVPTRSTVKQFVVDWAGGSKLKTIRPVSADSTQGVGEIRITQEGGKDKLRGSLVHDLPGPLMDVQLILVTGQQEIGTSPWAVRTALPAPVLAHAVATTYPAANWRPGDPWDLSLIDLKPDGKNVSSIFQFMKSLTEQLGRGDQGEAIAGDANPWRRLLGGMFLPLLDPPDLADRTVAGSPRLALRQHTHGLDLAAWTTQPCLIVIGQLDPATVGACPAPLYADTGGGFREVQTTGRTVIRWIYPLAGNPPAFIENQPDEVAEPEKTPSEEPRPAPKPRKGRG